ncbi:hypothetical protein EJB05_38056, partial [Eragrostis curvula]
MVMAKISEAAAAGTAVDMSGLFGSFTNDLACRAVMGKHFRNKGLDTQLQELIGDTSPLIGGFNVEEFFPFLARFGVLSKAVRVKSERVKRRWDKLLDELLQEHEALASDHKDRDDFIHVLLSVRQEVPEGQELVSEADIANMTYVRAVIKESLRLHPVAPLLAPHFSMSSCSIDGFEISENVRVLINAWAIGRDERYWEDAEEFVPERFLDGGDAEGEGNDFRFFPFGAGRRMCPGMNFGIATVEVMLANLVHRFDWELPLGQERRDFVMSEVFGLVVHRKEKLLLVPKPCV